VFILFFYFLNVYSVFQANNQCRDRGRRRNGASYCLAIFIILFGIAVSLIKSPNPTPHAQHPTSRTIMVRIVRNMYLNFVYSETAANICNPSCTLNFAVVQLTYFLDIKSKLLMKSLNAGSPRSYRHIED
jgi:hypothetical protein